VYHSTLGSRVIKKKKKKKSTCTPLDASGFRVQNSGCRVQGSGCRVQDSGFRVQGSGFRVQGAGFRVQGSGFRVQGSGSRVQGSGCKVQGSGFRVQGSGCTASFYKKGVEETELVRETHLRRRRISVRGRKSRGGKPLSRTCAYAERKNVCLHRFFYSARGRVIFHGIASAVRRSAGSA